MPLSRRQAVLGFVGSATSLSLFFLSGETMVGVQDELIPVDLGAVLPRGVEALGEAALKHGLSSDDDRELAALLEGVELADDPAEALLQKIRAAIDNDFATGRTVEIEGWRLSRSEAALCARYARLS